MGKGPAGFTEADRKKLEAVLARVNGVSEEVTTMKSILKKAVDVIDSQAKHISALYSQLNLCNYRNDSLNQYGRKESAIVNGLDPKVHGTDPEKIMLEIAEEIEEKAKDKNGEKIKINMTAEHIQRCHFMGESKKKLVCKFIPYRSRMKILLNKSVINGAKSGKYKNVFISEHLTPMSDEIMAHLVHEKEMFHKICKSTLQRWSDQSKKRRCRLCK